MVEPSNQSTTSSTRALPVPKSTPSAKGSRPITSRAMKFHRTTVITIIRFHQVVAFSNEAPQKTKAPKMEVFSSKTLSLHVWKSVLLQAQVVSQTHSISLVDPWRPLTSAWVATPSRSSREAHPHRFRERACKNKVRCRAKIRSVGTMVLQLAALWVALQVLITLQIRIVNQDLDLDKTGRTLEHQLTQTSTQDQLLLLKLILCLLLPILKKMRKVLVSTFQLLSQAKKTKSRTSNSLKFKPFFSERIQPL